MPKKITGVNPDFADFDEVDDDVLDAVEEFESGDLTYEELKSVVGHEEAAAIRDRMYGSNSDDLFDDPESF